MILLYHRSGNFCVKKLSYDKFSYKKMFVRMTPYRISVNSTCYRIVSNLTDISNYPDTISNYFLSLITSDSQ